MQEGQIAEIRAKFGRPGVSGRKRKQVSGPSEVASSSLTKAKRMKVRTTMSFSHTHPGQITVARNLSSCCVASLLYLTVHRRIAGDVPIYL